MTSPKHIPSRSYGPSGYNPSVSRIREEREAGVIIIGGAILYDDFSYTSQGYSEAEVDVELARLYLADLREMRKINAVHTQVRRDDEFYSFDLAPCSARDLYSD